MDTLHKKLDNLNEIKNRQYTGYIWMSDQSKPKLFFYETVDFSTIKTNPFIIEANLFAQDEKASISIKHLNGNYFIVEVDLKDANIHESQISEYLANPALSNIKKLKFKQSWIEKKDPLCEDLPVLMPAWRAFVGFEKEDEK